MCLMIDLLLETCKNTISVRLFCLLFFCSLKLECEKLASEKTEMQRHYIMVSPTCTLMNLCMTCLSEMMCFFTRVNLDSLLDLCEVFISVETVFVFVSNLKPFSAREKK